MLCLTWTLGKNLEEIIQMPWGYLEKINNIIKNQQGFSQKKPWQANLILFFQQDFQADRLESPKMRCILVLAFLDNFEKGQMMSCEFTNGQSTLRITG